MAGCLVPLLALAASAAGTGMQMAGQQKAQSAMNQKTLEELARQQKIQGKASQEFATSLSQSGQDTAQKQMGQGEQERLQGYEQAQTKPLALGNEVLIGGNSPAQNLQNRAQMMQSNQARAKLGSYDKWQLDQMVKNLHAGQQLQIYGQNAQNSQAVLPLELQNASHAGDMYQGIGSGLGLLGSALSLGGGLFSGGASAATTEAAKKVPTMGFSGLYGMY